MTRCAISRLASLLILVCLISISIAWKTTKGQTGVSQSLDSNNIVNLTRSLQVASSAKEKSGEQHILKITVINVSDKNVTSYAIRRSDGTTITTDGATMGWVLAPGKTDTISIPVRLSESEKFELSAVLLDDNDGDGDMQEISRMKDYRNAIGRQFERADLRFKEAGRKFSSAQAAIVLEDLENKLSQLPEEIMGGDVSAGEAEGLHHAKQFLLRQLRPSKTALQKGNSLQAKQAFVEASARIEEVLAKLKKSSFAVSTNPK